MEAALDSLTLWWREAGLHTPAGDEPRAWREEPAPAAVAAAPLPGAAPTAPPPLPVPATAAIPPASTGSLAAWLDWLRDDPAQPEAAWGGPAILPEARTGAPLLVVTDMAAPGAPEGALLDEGGARLLAAMLGAVGLRAEDTAFAPLLVRRPPGSLIDESIVPALGDRLRPYLAFTRPAALLLVGDRANRALAPTKGADASAHLPFVHHDGGMVPAMSVPQIEMMMRRPQAKAQSWRTLRHLAGALS